MDSQTGGLPSELADRALAPALQMAGNAIGPAVAASFPTEHNHGSVLWLANLSVMASLGCFGIALRLHRRSALRVLPAT
jgi:hypothetical protein